MKLMSISVSFMVEKESDLKRSDRNNYSSKHNNDIKPRMIIIGNRMSTQFKN